MIFDGGNSRIGPCANCGMGDSIAVDESKKALGLWMQGWGVSTVTGDGFVTSNTALLLDFDEAAGNYVDHSGTPTWASRTR